MTDLENRILTAAMRRFAHYGVKKTTMVDIARAAEVSRQSLYTTFPSKETILAECIRLASLQSIEKIRSRWEGVEDLASKLDIFFEIAAVAAFDLVRQSPDAEDLQDGYNAEGRAAIRETRKAKAELLAEAFEPNANALSQWGETPQSIATFVVSAALNFKHSAHDRNELLTLLKSLGSSALAAAKE